MVYTGHAPVYRRYEARGREDRPAVLTDTRRAKSEGMTIATAFALYILLSCVLAILGSCMVQV